MPTTWIVPYRYFLLVECWSTSGHATHIFSAKQLQAIGLGTVEQGPYYPVIVRSDKRLRHDDVTISDRPSVGHFTQNQHIKNLKSKIPPPKNRGGLAE